MEIVIFLFKYSKRAVFSLTPAFPSSRALKFSKHQVPARPFQDGFRGRQSDLRNQI